MTAANLRLGFAGTPEIASTILKDLLDHDQQVMCILSQPDRPSGRGRKIHPGPVKQLAEKRHIPLYQPANIPELEQIDQLSSLDVLVVVAYGLILPASVLALPRLGCINIHMSLLPRWRGAAPIQRAIEAGDKTSGVTLIQMDEGLDTGPILKQQQCSLSETETAGTLQEKLAHLGAECLREVLSKLTSGDIHAVSQYDAFATYAHKIDKAETWIDWNQPALVSERKIRAFNPAPVARAEIMQNTFRILEARTLPQSTSMKPGTIIQADSEGIDVATTDGVLRLLQIQLSGKRMMRVDEFLNGHPGFFKSS